MSTKLNAEELAERRWPSYFIPGTEDVRKGYSIAIREVAQPLADERDELREVVEQFVQWMKMGRKEAPLKLAEKVLAKYPKP